MASGGDISAVAASASRRPRTSMCLVKAGSRAVQIASPAFQSNPSLSRLTSLSFSSSRLGNVNKSPLLSLAASVPSPVIRYLINDLEKIVGLQLIVMASAPQSIGLTRAYGNAVQIGEPREIVDAMIDLKADYIAVHGEVSDAAPKVFLPIAKSKKPGFY